MKIKQYAAFALMGLALGACQKPGGEDPDVVEPEGELVKVQLAIKMPRSIRTYAPGDGDPNATVEEKMVNDVDVFIYNNGGSYSVVHKEYTPGGPELIVQGTAPNEYWVTEDIELTEGPKLVYVGINLPDFIRDRLATGYYVNETFQRTDLITELLEGTTGGGSSIVPFFNESIVNFDAGTDVGPIEVKASRLVSKIVVMAEDPDNDLSNGNNASWDVNGGTVSNFEFAIGQRNNQMFVSPLVSFRDPNFDEGTGTGTLNSILAGGSGPVLSEVAESDYKVVNDVLADVSSSATNMLYAPENTTESAWHQDVTYVSIKAQFTPHRLDDLDGAPGTPGQTFYAVFTGEATGDDALGVRYFSDRAEAETFTAGSYFRDLFNDPNDFTAPGDYVHEYENGECYYRIYLDPDASGGGNSYDVLRNTIYQATISGVNYIGTVAPDIVPGTDKTPTHPGEPVPTYLNFPVDPASPITTPNTHDIATRIEIVPWGEVEDSYELY